MSDEKKVQEHGSRQTERSSTAKASGDGGVAEVQQQFDKEQEQGFRGREADVTPNENYTIKGVTSGAPTPETDPDQAAKVGSTKFRGLDR
jgi:hypothetical protein